MEHIRQILEASIRLELLVSELYLLYSKAYQEDKGFWWHLSIEEKNHAALLKSCRVFLDRGMLPEELLHGVQNTLKEANDRLEELVKEFRASPLPMEEAYRNALLTESSAAELHYQKVMESDSDNMVVSTFKNLGKDDKDHASRIASLMSSHGMLNSSG